MSTIVIAGGTGFLGTALVRALRGDGHAVTVLTRRPRRDGEVAWAPGDSEASWTAIVGGAETVINLAGSSIGGGRWTQARKREILESRTQATRALVRACAARPRPSRVFVTNAAIGVYGIRGDEPVTEQTAPGSDFLSSVCREWESLALQAAPAARVVLLRTGLVLAREGGALPQLALPFTLFAGGPLGSGRQYMSWIHLHDWIEIVKWAIANPGVSGPLNVTAPGAVTTAEFARTIGRVMGRPAWLKTPAFALRLLLGEMADALVLGGQRVVPDAARRLGFVFRYEALEPALRQIYSS
jgi:uncharacterized protein (TIGR01777 family)